jgi:hypothetical protein
MTANMARPTRARAKRRAGSMALPPPAATRPPASGLRQGTKSAIPWVRLLMGRTHRLIFKESVSH